ncbi:MAG: flagellar basal body L-ring protein FlgH [Gammaproteobacteria bacterium]
MTYRTYLPWPLLSALILALSACGGSTRPSAEEVNESMRVPPMPARPMAVNNGGIYQPVAGLRLFADLRAGRVGDILTVVLNEQTNATKSSTTSTKKSNSTEAETATLLGIPVTAGGNPIFTNNLSTESEFEGEGGATISNQLEGSVTVTVVDRLANGNLVISGEKWLTLNQGKEYVRVSGIVRPIDIEPDNSVPSEKVANARIEYSGRGALADANRMNWLARFFNSPWLPF